MVIIEVPETMGKLIGKLMGTVFRYIHQPQTRPVDVYLPTLKLPRGKSICIKGLR